MPADEAVTHGEPPSTAVRAQILATEHWSLLGTRSTAWAEVMSRISIHLTVASAGLVVLALVAQVSGFRTAFHVLSIGLTSAILVLGTLTGIHVHNASVDDALLIMGMNRIRAAYLAIDPGLAEYFITSAHDDPAGVMRTYADGGCAASVHTRRRKHDHVHERREHDRRRRTGCADLRRDRCRPGRDLRRRVDQCARLSRGELAIGRQSFAKPPPEPRFPSPSA